ncbi:replication protein B [Ligilactobacillus acidipiscis]|uniref:Replication protein B n=1 Tax=Ligilactobacillus acidipiscis TaxID=89059 RepID=A0A0R2JV24_9LACO|nr:replication protein B [Ligilactobacillus acidipiscis]KRN80928.1 replication protein B [Ligilactobacillus acidipiscis]SPO49465.1 Transcriptional regulator OrfX [Ligilactobacillus acidipiscis]
MKTVQELADELGVTRQRVQQVLQALPKEKQAKKEKGRLQITEQVETDIKTFMSKKDAIKASKQTSKSDLLANLLKENNATLKDENEFLKEQIKDLQHKLSQEQNLVGQQHKLLDQEQQLHLADQKQITQLKKSETDNQNTKTQTDNHQQDEQSKKGFFERLFGK